MKNMLRICFMVFAAYFVCLGNLFSQECRAVTDCSTGRCIATTVCGGGSQAQISEPSRFQPLTIPAPLDVRLTNGNPNSQGRVDLTGRISGTPQVSDIRVNGTTLEVAPDSSGSFVITRALKEGVNEFELLVTDEFGRNYSSKISLYRSPNSLINAVTEKRVALVIGNGAYKDQPLSNPVNDADDFSRLISTMGFSVKNLRNANIASMRLALREFGWGAVPATLVGYVAGGIVSYWLNRRHTFASDRPHEEAGWRFAVVAGVGFCLTWVAMHVLHDRLGVQYILAQLVTTGIVLVWSFVANKLWTFGDPGD